MTIHAKSTSRRQVLLGAGVTVASIALRPWRTFLDVVGATPEERFAALLPSSDSTWRVGRAHMRSSPDEAHVSGLVAALLGAIDADRSSLPDDLAARVRRAIEDEFRRREVIHLDGWIASPTEARLAALATIVAGRHA